MIAFNAAVVQRRHHLRLLGEVLAVASLSVLIASWTLPGQAEYSSAPPLSPQQLVAQAVLERASVRSFASTVPDLTETQANDPLNSRFPIPWTLIQKAQIQADQTGKVVAAQYRSPVLQAPDGKVQAYSSISISITPKANQSQIFSQLVLTDAMGRVLQKIPASIHLGQGLTTEVTAQTLQGIMAILVPAAWSNDSQKLLVRQFEAVFGSDVASDYALVWQRDTQQVKTVTPLPMNYDTAILLGWSHMYPEQILFRTTLMGEPETAMVAIDDQGNTTVAQGDHPFPVGPSSSSWLPPAQAQFSPPEHP